MSAPQEWTDDDVEAAAREAFWTDDIGGHHKPGTRPHTWENIPEVGRENYRTLVRAVLAVVTPSIVARTKAHDAEVAAAARADWETDVLRRFIGSIPDSGAADWAPDYIHLLTTIMINARADESNPR